MRWVPEDLRGALARGGVTGPTSDGVGRLKGVRPLEAVGMAAPRSARLAGDGGPRRLAVVGPGTRAAAGGPGTGSAPRAGTGRRRGRSTGRSWTALERTGRPAAGERCPSGSAAGASAPTGPGRGWEAADDEPPKATRTSGAAAGGKAPLEGSGCRKRADGGPCRRGQRARPDRRVLETRETKVSAPRTARAGRCSPMEERCGDSRGGAPGSSFGTSCCRLSTLRLELDGSAVDGTSLGGGPATPEVVRDRPSGPAVPFDGAKRDGPGADDDRTQLCSDGRRTPGSSAYEMSWSGQMLCDSATADMASDGGTGGRRSASSACLAHGKRISPSSSGGLGGGGGTGQAMVRRVSSLRPTGTDRWPARLTAEDAHDDRFVVLSVEGGRAVG